MFLWIKEKRPIPTRSMKSVYTKNLVLQIDQGNLRNCLKTFALSMLTMEQGEPVKSSASTHIVKEQCVPEEHRDITSFNVDNEFNRSIDEENIDFNIPGVPNSTVKRSHGVNVQNLIQKIENHPQRQALQSDLQLIQEMKITKIQSISTTLYHVLHDTCKIHGRDIKDTVFWVDIDLGIKEGLKFYQTRSNAIILQGTLPACCIPKVERLMTGEVLYERPYLSPRPPPKISLRRDLNWTRGNNELGSTVEHRPVGKRVQQSLGETLQPGSSKPTQFPQTNRRSLGETCSSRDCW